MTRRRSRSGWYVPTGWPRPSPVVLRDRTTGTEYMLTHDGATDEIELLTPVPRRANAVPREPLVWSPAGPRRIYVDDGVLLAEDAIESGPEVRDGPLFTLNYTDQRTTYLIHGDSVTDPDGALCLIKYEDLGRTTELTNLGCNLLFAGTGGILDTAGISILDTAGTAIRDTAG